MIRMNERKKDVDVETETNTKIQGYLEKTRIKHSSILLDLGKNTSCPRK